VTLIGFREQEIEEIYVDTLQKSACTRARARARACIWYQLIPPYSAVAVTHRTALGPRGRVFARCLDPSIQIGTLLLDNSIARVTAHACFSAFIDNKGAPIATADRARRSRHRYRIHGRPWSHPSKKVSERWFDHLRQFCAVSEDSVTIRRLRRDRELWLYQHYVIWRKTRMTTNRRAKKERAISTKREIIESCQRLRQF